MRSSHLTPTAPWHRITRLRADSTGQLPGSSTCAALTTRQGECRSTTPSQQQTWTSRSRPSCSRSACLSTCVPTRAQPWWSGSHPSSIPQRWSCAPPPPLRWLPRPRSATAFSACAVPYAVTARFQSSHNPAARCGVIHSHCTVRPITQPVATPTAAPAARMNVTNAAL